MDVITLTGTWIDNGLFGDNYFDDETKNQLLESGKVSLFLAFLNAELNEQADTISLKLHGETMEQMLKPLHPMTTHL